MSVAHQWKLKEKEAAAAAAAGTVSKVTGPAAKGKTEAPSSSAAAAAPAAAKDAISVAAAGGSTRSNAPEKPSFGKSEEATQPRLSGPGMTFGVAYGKQGTSKLPVGKDTSRSFQVREAEPATTRKDAKTGGPQVTGGGGSQVTGGGGSQVTGGGGPQVAGAGGLVGGTAGVATSKIPVGAKENISTSGTRKTLGAAGPKKEISPVSSKVKTAPEGNKEPVAATKDVDGTSGDDGPFGSGRTKGLAGFWANQNDEVKSVKKKRLTAVEDNLIPIVVENTPKQLEGVVRAEDPGEWQKPIQLEDGFAKNVASSFQTRQQLKFARKSPVSLDTEHLNDRPESPAEPPNAQKINVKDISKRLVSQKSEPERRTREKAVIDRAPVAVVLAENEPAEVDPDVVRSDAVVGKEEPVLEKGRTRNLLQHWKNTEVEYNAPKTSTSRLLGSKPAWILEIEAAKGNSVEKNDEGPDAEDSSAIMTNDVVDAGENVPHLPEKVLKLSSAEPDDMRRDEAKTETHIPRPSADSSGRQQKILSDGGIVVGAGKGISRPCAEDLEIRNDLEHTGEEKRDVESEVKLSPVTKDEVRGTSSEPRSVKLEDAKLQDEALPENVPDVPFSLAKSNSETPSGDQRSVIAILDEETKSPEIRHEPAVKVETIEIPKAPEKEIEPAAEEVSRFTVETKPCVAGEDAPSSAAVVGRPPQAPDADVRSQDVVPVIVETDSLIAETTTAGPDDANVSKTLTSNRPEAAKADDAALDVAHNPPPPPCVETAPPTEEPKKKKVPTATLR